MYMLLQEKNGNQYMSGDKIVSGMDAIENVFHNQEKVNGGVMNGTNMRFTTIRVFRSFCLWYIRRFSAGGFQKWVISWITDRYLIYTEISEKMDIWKSISVFHELIKEGLCWFPRLMRWKTSVGEAEVDNYCKE